MKGLLDRSNRVCIVTDSFEASGRPFLLYYLGKSLRSRAPGQTVAYVALDGPSPSWLPQGVRIADRRTQRSLPASWEEERMTSFNGEGETSKGSNSNNNSKGFCCVVDPLSALVLSGSLQGAANALLGLLGAFERVVGVVHGDCLNAAVRDRLEALGSARVVVGEDGELRVSLLARGGRVRRLRLAPGPDGRFREKREENAKARGKEERRHVTISSDADLGEGHEKGKDHLVLPYLKHEERGKMIFDVEDMMDRKDARKTRDLDADLDF